MRELELKLTPPPDADVAALVAGVAMVEERGTKTLTATYYDTDDLRLARWGATLRYRTGEGARGKWTLKLPRGDDATDRDEIELPGRPGTVPDRAQLLTRAYVRSASIGPVVKLRTRRRSWALVDDGEELAELAHDEVSILDGRKVAGRFQEVEIEARGATRKQLKSVAAALERGGATAADPLPKAVRALGPPAVTPPDVPVAPPVGPQDPAAGAIRASLATATRRIVDAHAYVVLGDPEGVHRMRVGARRLRSDLRTFGSLLEPAWTSWITPELRWLGGVLGGVRELDVLIDRLHGHARDAAGDLGPLFERLEADRAERREEMLAALDSGRYVGLLVDLVDRANDPPVTGAAAASCAKVLPPLVEAAWDPLAKRGRLLDASDPEDEWHEVRIKAKRARYAAEAAVPALGSASKEAREFASCCAAVQDVLGEHQDAVVARDTVTAAAKEIEATPAFHFAAGRLAEAEDRAARCAREEFPQAWDNLDRKKRRRWLG